MFMRRLTSSLHRNRFFSVKSCEQFVYMKMADSPVEKEYIYQAVMDKPEEDNWSVTDLINKGFALSAIDIIKNRYVIAEIFEAASQQDVHQQYADIIASGQAQLREQKITHQYALYSSEPYAITKQLITPR